MNYEVISRPKSGLVFPKVISVDTEYSDLNIRKANLLSISVGVSPDLTYIIEDFKVIKQFIESAEIIFAWNMVVDWFMLNKSGFSSPKEKWIDGMLMDHLIDERRDHALGDYALREYNDNYKEEFWRKYGGYQEAPKEVAYEYEMRDGCYTFRAGSHYLASLKERMDLVQHVHRLQWSLFDTEIEGLKINLDLMKKTKLDMSEKINEYLPKLREEFNEHCKIWEFQKWAEEIAKRKTDKGKQGVLRPIFSFSSDRQLSWLLYSSMGIKPLNKTKKGNPSTDYETLKTLGETYPELITLVDYKETKSVYSTFVEGMLDRVENGRIYPRFNVNGTTTGRLSHANPNMGNLPREGVIRNFFIPEEGCSILGSDYSQLEVVVEANLTEDKSLLKIILEGASKHDITATGLGISRDSAKTLNFALQYGAGVFKISKILGISNKESQDVFDRYWQLYAGVKSLKDATARTLEKTGKVTNLFGRTRHFDTPKNEFEKAKYERQAYNHLIQGVGADMTNMATYTLANKLRTNNLGRLWFSCHDELICEVKDTLLEQGRLAIVESMEVPNDKLNLKYRVGNKLYGPLSYWSKS